MALKRTAGIASLLLVSAAGAQAQMTCRRLDAPVNVRAEGMTELLGDVVLACAGGAPTPAGAALPKFQLVVTSNAPLPSRILIPTDPTASLNETIVMTDEPDVTRQSPCTPLPGSGTSTCAVLAGAAGAPNIFQGQQVQQNAIMFDSIPIDPPGQGGTRLVRIANLRADVATLLGQAGTPATQVITSVQMFTASGVPVPVAGAERVSANIQTGLVFSVRTAWDAPLGMYEPGLTLTPALLAGNTEALYRSFHVKFTEGFADSFKRRNVGTSGLDPSFVQAQAVPGATYNAESGFYNNRFPFITNMNLAGLSESGTRLKVTFQNVPANVILLASVRDVKPGSTGFSANVAKALLTSADASGAGLFLAPAEYKNYPGYSQIATEKGTATAVWEVISSDPQIIEDFSFSVMLLPGTGAPSFGTAIATGALAPVHSTEAVTNATPPRFSGKVKPDAIPTAAFEISAAAPIPRLVTVSAASYAGPVAPDSIVSAFGSNLATVAESAEDTETTVLAGANVDVVDNSGTRRAAKLIVVTPSQVNFFLDAATKPGSALITISRSGRQIASGRVQVDTVAPALFSSNGDGRGIAAGQALRVNGAGSQYEPLANWDAAGLRWLAAPIDLGTGGDTLYLTLYGTGIRGRSSLMRTNVTVGGVAVPVIYAGGQGTFVGLDQLIAGPLPAALRGRGEVPVLLTVDGRLANELTVAIR